MWYHLQACQLGLVAADRVFVPARHAQVAHQNVKHPRKHLQQA